MATGILPAAQICGYDEIGKHAGFRCCHLSERFTAPFSTPVISKTEYAPVMELVDMRDLGSYVSNSTTLPLKNPLSIDIARFFSGPFVLDFGGYFGVLSSVLSCHLVYPYGHLFPDVL